MHVSQTCLIPSHLNFFPRSKQYPNETHKTQHSLPKDEAIIDLYTATTQTDPTSAMASTTKEKSHYIHIESRPSWQIDDEQNVVDRNRCHDKESKLAALGIKAGWNYSADSVASYDFIPSPHNKPASLCGPPKWHQDYQEPKVCPEQKPSSLPPTHGDANSNPNPAALLYHGSHPAWNSYQYTYPVSYPVAYPPVPPPYVLPPAQPKYAQALSTNHPPKPKPPYVRYAPAYEDDDKLISQDGTIHIKRPPPVWPPQFIPEMSRPPVPITNPAMNELATTRPAMAEFPATKPTTSKQKPLSVEDIVGRLLRWPQSAENVSPQGFITIGLPLVVNCLGPGSEEHMRYNPRSHRACLRRNSELRRRGHALGMPQRYMQWLTGENCSNVIGMHISDLQRAERVWKQAVTAIQDANAIKERRLAAAEKGNAEMEG